MHAADDSAYKGQLSGGFALLKFEPSLEPGFRVYYSACNLSLTRIALTLGLVFVGGMSLLDWRLNPGEFAARAAVVRLGLMAPMIAVSLLATFPGKLAPLAGKFFLGAGVAISGGSVVLLWLGSAYAVTPDYSGLVVITLYLYLMLGLRFFPTLCLTLPLLGGFLWVTGILAQPTAQFAYAGFSLCLVNLVAAAACYHFEHSARTVFLEREIANMVAGDDALTGIPSRKSFNTLLQRARRQANREEHGLAVALVELDDLDAFRSLYGQQATDMCLRRVAHAIMRAARRPLDFAARLSGGMFAVVFYDPDRRTVATTLSMIRDNVAMLDIPHESSPPSVTVTVSVGVAMSPPGTQHHTRALVEAAEEALQEAKNLGRGGLVVKGASGAASKSRVFIGPWRSSGLE